MKVTDEGEWSDKENTTTATSVVVVRPRRSRYPQRRRGFHQQMAPSSSQPQLASSPSAVATGNYHPSLSQEILDAFCMPVNALDAVDAVDPCRSSRDLQKPLRNRQSNHQVEQVPLDGNHHITCVNTSKRHPGTCQRHLKNPQESSRIPMNLKQSCRIP